MKKLLFILVLFTGFKVNAQTISLSQTFDIANITTADSVMFFVPNPGQWSVDVHWTGVIGSGGQIDLLIGNSDTTSVQLSNASLPYTMTGTSGTQVIHSGVFSWNRMWVKVIKGSTTAGNVYLEFNLNRLR